MSRNLTDFRRMLATVASTCSWDRAKKIKASATTSKEEAFRHWFSTKLEELGVSRVVRRDLLGHSPEDIADDYTHSTMEARRRAVELLCQTPTEISAEIQPSLAKVWQAPQSGLLMERLSG